MLTYPAYKVARLPEIQFGSGKIKDLPDILARYGQRVLLVTGKASFRNSPHWQPLLDRLTELSMSWELEAIYDEPSPSLVDQAVARHKDAGIEVVAGIGGGSVLDAAKAIAGLLITGDSVMAHLEGVGEGLPYVGPAVPLIAVPTTAGTGSEATKNAVLSERGPDGYKKSFRDDQLVARVALIDPDLLATCPKALIAADGMDAFTQLLESFVSRNASPFTDALAISGMQAFSAGFWPAWEDDHPDATAGYSRIAHASLCSGITLAQAGLGSVHGLASPLGAYYPIPHGVVCGTLLAEATRINIRAMQEREPNNPALARYAQAGEILTGKHFDDADQARAALVDLLLEWTDRLQLPRLSEYGMTADDIDKVVANSRGNSMKTNPLVLTDAEVAELVQSRL